MSKSLVALVGTQYRPPEAAELLKGLPNGEPLHLIREPTNKFDRNAVQVWARGVHIGFIKGSENREIASRMDKARTDSGQIQTLNGKLAIDGGKWPMVEIDN